VGSLSDHFSKSEFHCPCCNRAPVAKSLITGLESLRARLCKRFVCEVALMISRGGGYRCAEYNEGIRRCDVCGRNYHLASPYHCPECGAVIRQRSAKNSWHLHGGAADVRAVEAESGKSVSPVAVQEEARRVEQFKTGGIGSYTTFTHVDIGPARSWPKKR